MTKRVMYTTAIMFAVTTIIITTLPFSTSAVVSAQEQQNQQQISPTTSILLSQNNNSSLPPASFPLKTIFKQVENSTVQVTSKIPLGASSALNPQSPNATALGRE
jgi:hypothetical protein